MHLKNRFLFLLLSLLFLGISIYFFFNIVVYIVLAFILSIIGQPIMKLMLVKLRLKNYSWGGSVSAIVTLIIFIGAVALLISLLAPVLIDQAVRLANLDYGSLVIALEEPLERLQVFLMDLGIQLDENFSYDIVSNLFDDWFEPEQIGTVFTQIFSWASEIIVGVFSILFISFFFLQERGMFLQFIVTLVPNQYEEAVKNTLEDTVYLLQRYFQGVLLQMTVITVFITIALSIIGLQNAFLIGIIAALLNLIPYLGPILGAGFALAITLVTNSELPFYDVMLPLLFKVGVIFSLMQLLDNLILQPFIFSNRVMAHPLEIFIVVLLAAQVGVIIGIGAVVGMVLAIPTYTIFRVVARSFLSEFKVVQKLTNRIHTEKKHHS
jgi:predicted PurR-regulated permease PerM